MSEPDEQNVLHHNIVAVVGESPVVCRAIAHLVERGGYKTRVVDTMRDESELVDVDAVLIVAGANTGGWETSNCSRTVPVLRLVDTAEEKKCHEESVLWPCATRKLHSALSMAIVGHE